MKKEIIENVLKDLIKDEDTQEDFDYKIKSKVVKEVNNNLKPKINDVDSESIIECTADLVSYYKNEEKEKLIKKIKIKLKTIA